MPADAPRPKGAGMTRPKRTRLAEKRKKQTYDCRDLPILRRTFAQLTPKYALELALLHIGGGSYAVQIFWHPHEPTEDEMIYLAAVASAEVSALYAATLRHEEGQHE